MIIKLIVTLLIGALCGWLGSILMKTSGSLLLYIIIGIVGGFIGGWLLAFIPVLNGLGWVTTILGGVIGSCILIFLGKLIFKK